VREKIDVWSILNTFFVIAFAVLCIIPFYYVVTVSLSDPEQVREGIVTLIPRGFSLSAYLKVVGQWTFRNAFVVTVIMTSMSVVIALFAQAGMAYALSKRYIPGRKQLTFLVVFTILFFGGMIPTYLVVRSTGLLNTIWALVIPRALNSFYVIILINFFQNIPDSMEESAKLDGANDIMIFFRIILPLSGAAISTIGLFIAVERWNNLLDGILYIHKEVLKPLQAYLYGLVMQTRTDDMTTVVDLEMPIPSLSLQTAAIFAATLPILLVYPFIQRYFVKGVMLGAVKG
jgi:putative aldouronate transport system permease protein